MIFFFFIFKVNIHIIIIFFLYNFIQNILGHVTFICISLPIYPLIQSQFIMFIYTICMMCMYKYITHNLWNWLVDIFGIQHHSKPVHELSNKLQPQLLHLSPSFFSSFSSSHFLFVLETIILWWWWLYAVEVIVPSI